MEKANLEDSRLKIRTKKELYKIVSNRNIYLPSFHSKYITKEYLLNILKSNLFYLPSNLVTHHKA